MTIPYTAAWKQAENVLGATVPGTVDTTQRVSLGTVRRFYDANYGMGEFIYLKGVSSVVAGDPVTYSSAFVAARTAAGTGNNWAIATAAVDSATKYGWFQIGGQAIANKTKTVSLAAGALVGVSTAGLVITSSSLKELSGAVVAVVASATTTTNNGGKVVLMLNRPTGQTRIT